MLDATRERNSKRIHKLKDSKMKHKDRKDKNIATSIK